MKIFRIAFALYCLLIFLISFFVVIPLYFIVFNFFSKDKSPHIAHKISRGWAAYLFFFFFVRLKVENKDRIDPKKTYVFVSNHLSMLDIPTYALACKNTFRFLSKAELGKIPLLGYVIKKLYITVDRKNKNDRSKSLEKMLISLREEISVFLAPEGTRNTTGNDLLEFKDGAFRLAIASQIPIAILTIADSHKLLSPLRSFEIKPGTIHCSWSYPIETKGMTDNDLPMLKQKVREEMITFLKSKN